MTLGVFLAVMAAALLHAAWNALIKTGGSKIGAMVVLSAVEVPIGLAVAATRPGLVTEAIPYVVGAACCHLVYKLGLTFAYERGDLSRVYPIARGTAPLIVGIVSALFIGDALTGWEYLGITVLGLGILMMAWGVFSGGEDRRLIPFALMSAAGTATYTLVDGLGARVSGDAVGYIAWVFVADGLVFTCAMLAWRGMVIVPRGRRDWWLGSLASSASFGAYAVSVWAMTVAPIALVAALRETSILFAVLIGWLVFGERMTRAKALAAGVIVAGVAATRL